MENGYIMSEEKAAEYIKSLLKDMGIGYKKIDGKTIKVPIMKGKHPIYGNTFPKDSSSLLDHD